MNSRNTIKLVNELEKINNTTSKNSFFGAWIGLTLSIFILTYLFIELSKGSINNIWAYAIIFVIAILILLQSFYIIISTIVYKKISLIIKSVIDLEKS